MNEDKPEENGPGRLDPSVILSPLNKVRAYLIVSGILLVLVHGLELARARDVINQEFKGRDVPAAQVERGVWTVQLNAAAAIALGVIYIVVGIMLKGFPVPISILCLIFYLLYQGALAALNPATMLSNILFKIIVVVALVMAIVAAFAYQREMDDPLNQAP